MLKLLGKWKSKVDAARATGVLVDGCRCWFFCLLGLVVDNGTGSALASLHNVYFFAVVEGGGRGITQVWEALCS